MASSYIQVPPNSTGSKVATIERTELVFDNYTGPIYKDNVLTGSNSGATGIVTAVVLDANGTTGEIYLKKVIGTFINDEPLQVEGTTRAIANIIEEDDYYTFETQSVVIADPNNPDYLQKIDRNGATVNTFSDGSPVFGSFGSLLVGTQSIIRGYHFPYDTMDEYFWTQTSGTASQTLEANSGCNLLTTGTVDGDMVSRTTHYYHPYRPGVGHITEFSVRIGDSGKANVVRRWGYYDDNDGAFWELDGTTLNAVLRSSVSGVVTERRVAQAAFNESSLTGADEDDFNMDITAGNIFQIDFQWLGAGRVRFSVLDQYGQKKGAHTFLNVGDPAISFPYMRTASLPVRYEQFNNGAAASSSEMRVNCISVVHSDPHPPKGKFFTNYTGLKTITLGSEVPVLVYRPALTYKGHTNRTISLPINFTYINTTNTGGGHVVFRVYGAPDASGLTGATWGITQTNAPLQADSAATAFNTAVGQLAFQRIVGGDEHHEDHYDPDPYGDFILHLNADGVTQPCYVMTAELLTGTNADVGLMVDYEGIEL